LFNLKNKVLLQGVALANPQVFLILQLCLLTIYDMRKAVDRGMVMSDIRVMEKQGGKSGHWKVES